MAIVIRNRKKPERCGRCHAADAFDCHITGLFIDDHSQILPSCPIATENELIYALTVVLQQYFGIGDCYTYELTRDKKGFTVGTVDLDDFQEWDEENIEDLAQYIVSKLPEALDAKEDR